MFEFLKELHDKMLDQPTKSLEQIANDHQVELSYLEAQLEKGIKVEMEHTTHEDVAKEIALDHLSERPDYYDKLEEVEENGH